MCVALDAVWLIPSKKNNVSFLNFGKRLGRMDVCPRGSKLEFTVSAKLRKKCMVTKLFIQQLALVVHL